ncbi:hypothetical protein, partial [Flavihumibacter sp. CACIAM 22H1]|uniref:hypothetical protein n=1 Tax=Flavihumibacter sp. CACIAM 22H1 TaxID=1812911 RepID=UPI0025B7C91F
LLYCAVAGLSWFIVDILPLNGAFGKLIIAGLLFFGAYASLVLLFSKEISANLLAALKTKNTA